ncbi:mannuronan 5-epimerase AlgG [Pseudomonas borbori]
MNATSLTWITGLLIGGLSIASSVNAETDAAATTPELAALQLQEPTPIQELRTTDNYTIVSAPTEPLHMDPPKLPDISQFTAAAVQAKIDRKRTGRAGMERMLQQDTLKEFTGGDERLREWVKRQREMPQAIFIEGGYITPREIAKQVPSRYFEETAPGVFIARVPVIVGNDSTLHIDEKVKDFRLSQDRGSFLINDGKLFITDTKLTAWNEAKKAPAWWKKADTGKFRPFLNSWGGTETYVVNSTITSLGYSGSKSYGFSISQYSPSMAPKMKRGHPTGWLLNSTFDDMWYGFYCYEADDVVLLGNTYKNNIVYGIDPHDRSKRLVIGHNTAHGTVQKHGIIISREVNDSWIFNNRSYDNKLSGIVIDRSSVNNVIAYNESYQNYSDGITVYESGSNLFWGNQVMNNMRHGIRVRNSTDIKLYENLSIGNQLTGVYGHIKDLTGTDRDIELDPFDTQVSLLVVGGKLAGNGSGPISVDSPLSLEMYKVELLAPTKSTGITMGGVLGLNQELILDMLIRKQQAVLIDPVESQQELLQ